MHCDLRRPTFPVAFDFEGAWSRLCGLPCSARYPRSLGGSGIASVALREKADILAGLPMWREADSDPLSASLDRWRPQTRKEKRWVRRGGVVRRWMLDPALAPTVAGQRIERLVLFWGRLRPGRSAEDAFRTVLIQMGARPFLFATDETQVMVGIASSTGSGSNTHGRLEPFWSLVAGGDFLQYDRNALAGGWSDPMRYWGPVLSGP